MACEWWKRPRRSGRILMVGHNMRMGPALEHSREAVAHRLGRIVSVEVHFSADNTQRMPPDAWRLRPELCPLMPVMQLGIHGIDLVHDLAGPITSVNAVARAVTTPPDVLDSVSAVFTLESGATGTIVSNYCTQIRFEYRIAGTKGMLVGTPHSVWFRANADTDAKGDGSAETFDYTTIDRVSYERQMQAFAEAVRAGASVGTQWARRPPGARRRGSHASLRHERHYRDDTGLQTPGESAEKCVVCPSYRKMRPSDRTGCRHAPGASR
jgi:predicted dehydrogenase